MSSDTQRERGDRPFPWRCPNCRQREVVPQTVPYTIDVKHDGLIHTIHLPGLTVPKCRSCGHLLFDDQADEQISAALRQHLRLLSPEQIRGNRKALALSQRELAERLGIAEETISRWETGALIQSRAMDNLLRIYFANADVRAALVGSGQDPSFGAEVSSSST
jgi:putative zinc finger/helix-turn-helix YgiT family protein